ncbi:3-hydroxylacyl-ACP dehydratase [Acidithiobacillus sp.]|uniref:3-hydroxylacyl-ACP dehydratase n=1 Tax=Acidithiobacillus sp. TaxID=1872118 RepID=UPI0025BF0FB5|nr:3-hydroxylacyl-ACP dehydratase [Acidithiobacillus sp.]MCK9188869.1 3-hydroxylacyl-ACP dehydratase [Acidithiobacillus sp.]MCK9358346.1 3-hydroxylacyl-ACP dehydratase [Acidithiobacillus sp.]
MRLDRQWIAKQIPHQGGMHLLNTVERWDENTITCTATSHRWETLPLRAHGRLGAACGIEYAAQTMAVHSALLCSTTEEGRAAQLGYLISVRNIVLRVSRLDDIDDDLTITAEKLSDKSNLLYRFSVLGQGRVLLDGRAALLLDTNPSAAVHSPALPADSREEPHA